MANSIDIDCVHSRAIVQEIGERLDKSLRPESELPANLKMQVDRLRKLEEPAPIDVEHCKNPPLSRR
jgi:hypothetical protein